MSGRLSAADPSVECVSLYGGRAGGGERDRLIRRRRGELGDVCVRIGLLNACLILHLAGELMLDDRMYHLVTRLGRETLTMKNNSAAIVTRC